MVFVFLRLPLTVFSKRSLVYAPPRRRRIYQHRTWFKASRAQPRLQL